MTTLCTRFSRCVRFWAPRVHCVLDLGAKDFEVHMTGAGTVAAATRRSSRNIAILCNKRAFL